MHPFKSHAEKSHKSKRSSMTASGAQKLPNMYMSGAYKHVDKSSDSMQHKDQSAAPGMKRGGRLDKKHSKHKSPIARDMVAAPPPSPEDMIAAQAGAGGTSPSPVPAPPPGGPPPGMPMQKHGGRVKKYADGGGVKPVKEHYPITAGGMTGQARLQEAASYKKNNH